MSTILAEIDGAAVSLDQCSWSFRKPCGCAFGVLLAVMPYGGQAIADEDAAWRFFYEGERNRARLIRSRIAAGFSVKLCTRDVAVDAIREPQCASCKAAKSQRAIGDYDA